MEVSTSRPTQADQVMHDHQVQPINRQPVTNCLITTTILEIGEIFFFFLKCVCAFVQEDNYSLLDSASPPDEDTTQP